MTDMGEEAASGTLILVELRSVNNAFVICRSGRPENTWRATHQQPIENTLQRGRTRHSSDVHSCLGKSVIAEPKLAQQYAMAIDSIEHSGCWEPSCP